MFKIIDLERYKRKEYFNFYAHNIPCSFEITVKLDISSFYYFIKNNNYEFYPCFIHTISKSINAFDNFKFSLDQNKQLICYDIIHPSYTIFHKDSKTFSVLWTFYKENLNDFLSLYEEDKQLIKNNKSMFLKEPIENLFNISAIPWIVFENFSLHLPKKEQYFFPIITSGKIIKENKKFLIPFSININHATNDAYHIYLFLEKLQENLNSL
ncbi:CatA-like O-acetyltransferase [Campylobacter lari]|nr:chloramphenicol acetyltransferase CAT [Campylobacter lari]EAK0493893.1 chloramphenicol acetyltransferase CAT [Campylobacter lari]EAK9999539.1 chloramphenicol acetyltransferase CAT [Campylobacter lari]EFO9448157.1 chloramphenicol acetyltransferase CAT [Campylobacter lari]